MRMISNTGHHYDQFEMRAPRTDNRPAMKTKKYGRLSFRGCHLNTRHINETLNGCEPSTRRRQRPKLIFLLNQRYEYRLELQTIKLRNTGGNRLPLSGRTVGGSTKTGLTFRTSHLRAITDSAPHGVLNMFKTGRGCPGAAPNNSNVKSQKIAQKF